MIFESVPEIMADHHMLDIDRDALSSGYDPATRKMSTMVDQNGRVWVNFCYEQQPPRA
jgi:hypothetical protein